MKLSRGPKLIATPCARQDAKFLAHFFYIGPIILYVLEISMAQPVSVLVDGDNISGKHAGEIFSVAAQYGEPTLARVYTDAQRPSDWHSAIGYRMLHAGTGKNAADILLALDALELALSKNMRCFVIASSDGDFTHLATRLREHGARVIGIGELKAPSSFRACCSDFVEIGTPLPECLVPKPPTPATALDQKIRLMIGTHSKKGMRIVELSSEMHRHHGVRISTYPERSWRAYLSARPILYELDPRGPEAMVRFRPEGFAHVA
ncbi:NYN domain-containing protein [Sulfitobacter sp. 1A05707]|uniref:NYN domain-containing protein n=1 Tax=Sulfitobacter sp. 1A05707 TaxID=3368560 RepID=UPI003745D1FA